MVLGWYQVWRLSLRTSLTPPSKPAACANLLVTSRKPSPEQRGYARPQELHGAFGKLSTYLQEIKRRRKTKMLDVAHILQPRFVMCKKCKGFLFTVQVFLLFINYGCQFARLVQQSYKNTLLLCQTKLTDRSKNA